MVYRNAHAPHIGFQGRTQSSTRPSRATTSPALVKAASADCSLLRSSLCVLSVSASGFTQALQLQLPPAPPSFRVHNALRLKAQGS
ncbi:unnamed protein product [Tilletia caries]|nr:unnamed protein product [Tilletia caries]